jgi:hypothetical protein
MVANDAVAARPTRQKESARMIMPLKMSETIEAEQ